MSLLKFFSTPPGLLWRSSCRQSLLRVAFLIVFFLSGRAEAGNEEGIPIGIEASLLGGAVTARVSDASAAWYNPAGIAHSTRTTVNLNVSVYGFDSRKEDAVIVTPDGDKADAKFVNWKLVPSTFGVVRQVTPTMNIAVVMFVPTTVDFMFQTELEDDEGKFNLAASNIGSAYYVGVSAGWRLARNLRLGVTLFGLYQWSYRSLLASAADGNEAVLGSEIVADSRYGLRANVGFQWDITSKHTLGMSIMTPSVIMATSESRTGALQSQDDFNVSAGEVSEIDPYFFAPPKLRAGLHSELSEKWDLDIDLSLASPIRVRAISEGAARGIDSLFSRRFLWNVAVGVLYRHNEDFNYGMGVFTDRDPWLVGGLTFAGLTAGVRFKKHYELKDGDSVVVESSLGGRYAYGVGDGFTVTIDPGESMETSFTDKSARVHEFSLNIGSAVHF